MSDGQDFEWYQNKVIQLQSDLLDCRKERDEARAVLEAARKQARLKIALVDASMRPGEWEQLDLEYGTRCATTEILIRAYDATRAAGEDKP